MIDHGDWRGGSEHIGLQGFQVALAVFRKIMLLLGIAATRQG